jgi:hypothetical protein
MVKFLGFEKFGGIFSIILGGLAVLAIFLPIGIINAFGLITIEVSSLGDISGFPLFSTLSDLEPFTGPVALIPSILGYIMLILTIIISIVGIIQIISNEAKSVVIFLIMTGIILILLTGIQFYIFKYIKGEIPTIVLFLEPTLTILLNMASADVGIGFYIIIIPTVGVIITSLLHLIAIRRLPY